MRVQRCASPVHAVVSMAETNNNSNNNVGKVLKNSNGRSGGTECPQILMYLERLQHLVPSCPKDRPINKLELIQRVIDYIYDLEHVLSSSDTDSDDSMDSS